MSTNSDYVNSVDYKQLSTKLRGVLDVMKSLEERNEKARKLRYTEIDIEAERSANRIAPDELIIPQHVIDSNIRKEQSSYVQYITQSNRAAVMVNKLNPEQDTQLIERDFTMRVRFDGWQIPIFAGIDGMQQNGYSVFEVVFDVNKTGHLAYEFVSYGDFGLPDDTKDLQEAEMVVRHYYFSKTRLMAMAADPKYEFNPQQVKKIIDREPDSERTYITNKEKSLYRLQKVMFRVNGIVHVAWACENTCDDWIRAPRPLYVGRRKAKTDMSGAAIVDQMTGVPVTSDDYERSYPYFLFPYLISENDMISRLRGRAYLDQDTQEAATSLLSSFCTSHRRASGLYFSKEGNDPNDDVLQKKNIYFKTGALINANVKQFQLTAPGAEVLSAIQALITSNMAEMSQVNWAAQNRKDSRKTATEVSASMQTQQALSTVQVVLFSNALRNMYNYMFGLISSRVAAGQLKVPQSVFPMYSAEYDIKPSGDIDVIERQQMIQQMQQAWGVIQNTPAAMPFLFDMLIKMFPDNAPKYISIMQQAMQAQQQQQSGVMQQIGMGLVKLAQSPDMFSDTGKQQALPQVQQAAAIIQNMMGGGPQNGQ